MSFRSTSFIFYLTSNTRKIRLPHHLEGTNTPSPPPSMMLLLLASFTTAAHILLSLVLYFILFPILLQRRRVCEDFIVEVKERLRSTTRMTRTPRYNRQPACPSAL